MTLDPINAFKKLFFIQNTPNIQKQLSPASNIFEHKSNFSKNMKRFKNIQTPIYQNSIIHILYILYVLHVFYIYIYI